MPGRLVHLITPGDHYSPLTGSAIPTVVHGLASATPPDAPRPAVLVARGTMAERYPSAECLEYDAAAARPVDRYLDLAAGRLGLPRPGIRRSFAAALAGQDGWPDGFVLAHNAPGAVPLVAARHQAVLYAHNQVLRTYGRREATRVLSPAAAIVCVSDYLAEDTARLLPRALRGRVHAVRNGVDAALFAGPRSVSEALRVTFVGRVIPDKGPHVLLEAVRRLDRPDVEVTIVGRQGFAADAPLTAYEQQLRTGAAQVRSPVRFASFVPRTRLPEILRATDVLVVPSVWPEPFGLTALEGMAAGAAVIASDIGGVPEAIGSAGVLVPPGDAPGLADAIAHFADDRAALGETAARGRRHAEASSWERASESLGRCLGLTVGRSR